METPDVLAPDPIVPWNTPRESLISSNCYITKETARNRNLTRLHVFFDIPSGTNER